MEGCYCTEQGCSYEGRIFLTKEEKIQKLEKYKESLDLESKAVSERLAELKEE